MLPNYRTPLGAGGSFPGSTTPYTLKKRSTAAVSSSIFSSASSPFSMDSLDAVLDVVLEQDGANLLQRRDDAGDLGQDVHAVGFLVYHPLHASHLALDPLEAVLEQLLSLAFM